MESINMNTTETTKETKWSWDRSKQHTRDALAKNTSLRAMVAAMLNQSGGTTITESLRAVCATIVSNTTPGDDWATDFAALSKVDQRLVIRKILHSFYKDGTAIIVHGVSEYRTGKKSNTKVYLVK